MRENLSELKLLIIDEVSLISSDMLYKLDARLKEIFHLKKKIPFGGVSVMLVGDLLQIPPVSGGLVFTVPKKSKNKVAHDLLNLWELFDPFILRHNHRQGDGCLWANILNEFRLGIVSEENLKLLQQRETDDPHHDLDSMHLAYGNDIVQDHNHKMLNQLKTPLVQAEAIKLYPKGRKPTFSSGGRIEDLNVLNILKVKLGARVVMVYNVNTIDDLVNGSTGTIIGLEFNSEKELECIIVRFDKESMGRQHRERYPKYAEKYKFDNGTPIFREEMEVMGKTRKGRKLGMGSRAKIIQFPLVVNYASNNHKIQVKNCKHALNYFEYSNMPFFREQLCQPIQKWLFIGAENSNGKRMLVWVMLAWEGANS